MGSKEPTQRMILLQRLQYQRNDKSKLSWSLYRLKPRSYNLYKKITNYVTKERPLGGFERSKSHFGQKIPFFSVRPAKWQQVTRITNSPKHFKSAFGSAYFISKINEIKLAKPTKKEPRKASFPWDLGFLFGNPIRCALYCRIWIFKERKRNYLMSKF